MLEWPLVGRGEEQALLRRLAADRHCHGAVLMAPAGSGKTRLAREFVRSLSGGGMATLVATASRAAAGVPFGAVASMLSASGGVDVPADEPSAFMPLALRHVLAQAGSGRVCVLVDDAHVLDSASAALVAQLAQHPEVFLLLTVRSGEPAPEAITGLWTDGALTRLDVEDLPPNVLEELLGTVLAGPVDGAALTTLINRSQGNMLFLRELVVAGLADHSLRHEHGLWRFVGASVPSDRLVELVEARLIRLDAGERKLLELLAIGEPLGAHELEALSSVETADRLEARGLIGRRSDGRRLEIRLAHPIYGEVLRSRLTGLQSRHTARRLAECVEATGMRRRYDVLRVATWRLAGGGGRADQLLEAATAARWQWDLPLALRLASKARSAGAGREASLLMAGLLLLHGQRDEADALLADLAGHSSGADRVRAILERARIAHMRARPVEMQRLLDEAGTPPDRELAAALQGLRAVNALFLDGPRAVVELSVPDSATEQGPDGAHSAATAAARIGRALGLSRMGRSELAGQEIEQVASIARSVGDLGWWRFPHEATLSEILANSGRLSEGIELCLRQYGDGLARGSAEMQLFAGWQLGCNYVWSGSLSKAEKFTHEAIALCEQLGHDVCWASATPLLAMIHAMCGRPREAREALLANERAGIAPNGYNAGTIGQAAAWTAITEGDVQRARDLFLATADECRRSGDVLAAAGALHGLVRMGDAKLAFEPLTALAEGVDNPWVSLYVRHAVAAASRDARAVYAVSEDFERIGALLLGAEAAGDASRLWQRRGNTRLADGARRRAAALADQCEGARTPGVQGLAVRVSLTPAEQEAARYVAAGHANKVIAERLGVSIRTIESRLHSVYLKLGIGRHELASAVLGDPPRPDDQHDQ